MIAHERVAGITWVLRDSFGSFDDGFCQPYPPTPPTLEGICVLDPLRPSYATLGWPRVWPDHDQARCDVAQE